jgi:hypothetical protein
MMKTPKAMGMLPADIGKPVTVFVAVAITDTVFRLQRFIDTGISFFTGRYLPSVKQLTRVT